MDQPTPDRMHAVIDEKLVPHQLEHVEARPGSEGSKDLGLEGAESLAARKRIEKRLVWKQDIIMLPLLAMCFFFSYVVSSNLSFCFPHSVLMASRIEDKSEMRV
jgi:hypothetical protein